MKCFVGMGSNLGDRRGHLEVATRALKFVSQNMRLSPIYETPALVTEGAPREWRIPYLNAVAEIEWTGNPQTLLAELKKIERQMGRGEAPRWAPRNIDLDLLLYGNEIFHSNTLTLPHQEMTYRSFVLDPLKDLAPSLKIPGFESPVTVQARKLTNHSPLLMGIINLTPDSFSDGGESISFQNFQIKVSELVSCGAQIIDIGAESTRPGATPVSVDEEWSRIKDALRFFKESFYQKLIRPLVSLDSRRPQIVERALEWGVDLVNDVGGLSDPLMLEILKSHRCDVVLMHSLTVPADSKIVLDKECDPVLVLKRWLSEKLEKLDSLGIDTSRVIFDPGIGFGKTALQSQEILRRIREFSDLPLRLMVGHSRKSFMKNWGIQSRDELDAATLGISSQLCISGVDILRVHNLKMHVAALRGRQEVI